jgi:hypothetical protein
LFISGYYSGMHVLWNDAGTFDFANISRIANRPDAVLSQASSFGDVDRDGDLDLLAGNWAAGWYRHYPGDEARNRIVFNEGGVLSGENVIDLEGFTGETLSTLLTDFDRDGDLDILEANDFEIADQIYFGDGAGAFQRTTASDGIFSNTTNTTMSVKSADFDNDAAPELLFTQISGRSEGLAGNLTLRPLELYCFDLENSEEAALCQANINANLWYKAGGRKVDVRKVANCADNGPVQEAECRAMLIKAVAMQRKDASVCNHIPEDQLRTRLLCETHFIPKVVPSAEQQAEGLAQTMAANVVLKRNDLGIYDDVTEDLGLQVGGWTWDIKIEDFALDGWIDIYITNGSWIVANQSPSNMYYANDGDGTFTSTTSDVGLEEFLILPSLTSIDIDNDGDLDMIGQAVNGPVMAYRNNSQRTQRIAFQMRDEVGNSHCAGCRIKLHMTDGTLQEREVQIGGGYLSYDTTKSYFGLPAGESVKSVQVFWSTGETTTLNGPFPVGSLHTLTRSKSEG